MTTQPTLPTLYRTEIVVVFSVTTPASSPQEAEELARRRALDHRVAKDEILEATAVAMDIDEQVTQANVRLWQEHEALKHATSNQRQRYAAGLLPDEELAEIARAQLFMPFAMFTRRVKLKHTAIPHPRYQSSGRVSCGDGDPPVSWSTEPIGRESALTQDQWQTVLRLESAMREVRAHQWLQPSSDASSAVRVGLREHRGVCHVCKNTIVQASALVEIDWAGRTLSREYVL